MTFNPGPCALQLTRDLWEFIRRGSVPPRDGFSLLSFENTKWVTLFLAAILGGCDLGRSAPALFWIHPPFVLEDGQETSATRAYLSLFEALWGYCERELRARLPLESQLLADGQVRCPEGIESELRTKAKETLGIVTLLPHAYSLSGLTAAGIQWLSNIADHGLPPVEAAKAEERIRAEADAIPRPADPAASAHSRDEPVPAVTGSPEPDGALPDTPKWTERSNYVGRAYLALEDCYLHRPGEFISTDTLNQMSGDKSAKQAVDLLKSEHALSGLIESVRDAKKRGKPVPEDAQGYRLTALPESRKGRESR
jgi:hypothetical protein